MRNRLGPFAFVDAVFAGLDRQYAALDLVTAQGTAVPATLTALAAVAGDSLAIKNCGLEKKVQMLQLWTDVQTAGTVRVRSPRLHDNVQGIRYATVVADVFPILPFGVGQRVYPNDLLTVELSAGAVAGDIESVAMLNYYEDLPGVQAIFITPEEVMRRGVNIFTVENTLALGTAGGYSGGEAINVEFDQFKANTKYALVGYTVSAQCAVVGWRGPDTGNTRLGGPGLLALRELTADWFIRLSKMHSLPLIPVISAENKGATLIDGVQDENGVDVTVNSIFVELAR
jgi:hypothetical protein